MRLPILARCPACLNPYFSLDKIGATCGRVIDGVACPGAVVATESGAPGISPAQVLEAAEQQRGVHS